MTVKFNVANMNCANCAKNITRVLNELSGVNNVDIDLDNKNVVVSFDEQHVTPNEMIDKMESISYHAKISN